MQFIIYWIITFFISADVFSNVRVAVFTDSRVQTSRALRGTSVSRTTGPTSSPSHGTAPSLTVALRSLDTLLRSVTHRVQHGSRLVQSRPTAVSSRRPTCLRVSTICFVCTPWTRLDQVVKQQNWIVLARLRCLSVSTLHFVSCILIASNRSKVDIQLKSDHRFLNSERETTWLLIGFFLTR